MIYKKESISNIQKYVSFKAKERGFGDETIQERLLLLTEELGEVVKACRKGLGMHTDLKKIKAKDSNIGEELADVLTMLCWTAEGLNVDLENEFIQKDKINEKRIWKRKKLLKSTS
jgi:NTP pyrophosphatase (non-canonical NTP hydrolase)